MTYSSGGLIEAADYNGFVNVSANNVNAIWATGSTDKGWGQSALATVAGPSPGPADTVTATSWASLVNTLASMGNQTNTTITSRTAPVTGNTISVLANVATDINSITANRGNAVGVGSEYGIFTGTTSKTTATGSGQAAWTITFTHTVTFASADAARYFWNAGGIVRIKYGKSSTGTDVDADWNTFAGLCGSINITGRVNSNSQLIAGTTYTGTTRIGGTGGTQTVLATTTGWYNLVGPGATTIFQLNNASSPYTADFIRTTATPTSSTVLTLITTWSDAGSSGAGTTANISGGTATTSPSTTITGTAPTTLVTYFPPSTTYLSNTWGTPAIAASVV